MKVNELVQEIHKIYKNYNILYTNHRGTLTQVPESNSVFKYKVYLESKEVYINTYKHTLVKDLDFGAFEFEKINIFNDKYEWLVSTTELSSKTISDSVLNSSAIRYFTNNNFNSVETLNIVIAQEKHPLFKGVII